MVAGSSSSSASVFDNGLPVGATTWIDRGTLAALVETRHSAALAGGVAVTPPASNLLLEAEGATATLEQMVASTERGLLLTCLWYIREVDPQTLLLTGLTRDGVYLVEHGEVVGAANNFRFNESPVDLLGRVAEVGAQRGHAPARVERLLHAHPDADPAGARLQHELGVPGLLTRVGEQRQPDRVGPG